MQLYNWTNTKAFYNGQSQYGRVSVVPLYIHTLIYLLYTPIIHMYTQDGLFNFHPAVRPVQLEVHIDGFPWKHNIAPGWLP